MNKYTVLGEKVDRVIDGHMRVIVRELKKLLGKNLVSVVLFGGFARGEGSVLVKGKRVIPLNDYDVVVVTKSKVEDKVLEKLSLDLNKILGVKSEFTFNKGSTVSSFYTDFKNFAWEELQKLPPVMKYYELRHSGRVLWGKDALSRMPRYRLKQMPIMDGLRVIFNRAALTIECFRIEFFEKKMNEREKQTMVLWASKAYLGIGSGLLIASGRFACSYKKRAEIFKKYYKKDFPELARKLPDLPKRIDYFTEFKLKPNFDQKDPMEWWFKARDDVLIVSEYFFENVLGLKARDPEELGQKVEALGFRFLEPYIGLYLQARWPGVNKGFVRRVFYPLAVLKFNWAYFKQVLKAGKFYPRIILNIVDPNLRIFRVVPILLSAISRKGKIDFEKLKIAFRELKKIYPSPSGISFKEKNDLDEMFLYFSDVYRVYQFVKV